MSWPSGKKRQSPSGGRNNEKNQDSATDDDRDSDRDEKKGNGAKNYDPVPPKKQKTLPSGRPPSAAEETFVSGEEAESEWADECSKKRNTSSETSTPNYSSSTNAAPATVADQKTSDDDGGPNDDDNNDDIPVKERISANDSESSSNSAPVSILETSGDTPAQTCASNPCLLDSALTSTATSANARAAAERLKSRRAGKGNENSLNESASYPSVAALSKEGQTETDEAKAEISPQLEETANKEGHEINRQKDETSLLSKTRLIAAADAVQHYPNNEEGNDVDSAGKSWTWNYAYAAAAVSQAVLEVNQNRTHGEDNRDDPTVIGHKTVIIDAVDESKTDNRGSMNLKLAPITEGLNPRENLSSDRRVDKGDHEDKQVVLAANKKKDETALDHESSGNGKDVLEWVANDQNSDASSGKMDSDRSRDDMDDDREVTEDDKESTSNYEEEEDDDDSVISAEVISVASSSASGFCKWDENSDRDDEDDDENDVGPVVYTPKSTRTRQREEDTGISERVKQRRIKEETPTRCFSPVASFVRTSGIARAPPKPRTGTLVEGLEMAEPSPLLFRKKKESEHVDGGLGAVVFANQTAADAIPAELCFLEKKPGGEGMGVPVESGVDSERVPKETSHAEQNQSIELSQSLAAQKIRKASSPASQGFSSFSERLQRGRTWNEQIRSEFSSGDSSGSEDETEEKGTAPNGSRYSLSVFSSDEEGDNENDKSEVAQDSTVDMSTERSSIVGDDGKDEDGVMVIEQVASRQEKANSNQRQSGPELGVRARTGSSLFCDTDSNRIQEKLQKAQQSLKNQSTDLSPFFSKISLEFLHARGYDKAGDLHIVNDEHLACLLLDTDGFELGCAVTAWAFQKSIEEGTPLLLAKCAVEIWKKQLFRWLSCRGIPDVSAEEPEQSEVSQKASRKSSLKSLLSLTECKFLEGNFDIQTAGDFLDASKAGIVEKLRECLLKQSSNKEMKEGFCDGIVYSWLVRVTEAIGTGTTDSASSAGETGEESRSLRHQPVNQTWHDVKGGAVNEKLASASRSLLGDLPTRPQQPVPHQKYLKNSSKSLKLTPPVFSPPANSQQSPQQTRTRQAIAMTGEKFSGTLFGGNASTSQQQEMSSSTTNHRGLSNFPTSAFNTHTSIPTQNVTGESNQWIAGPYLHQRMQLNRNIEQSLQLVNRTNQLMWQNGGAFAHAKQVPAQMHQFQHQHRKQQLMAQNIQQQYGRQPFQQNQVEFQRQPHGSLSYFQHGTGQLRAPSTLINSNPVIEKQVAVQGEQTLSQASNSSRLPQMHMGEQSLSIVSQVQGSSFTSTSPVPARSLKPSPFSAADVSTDFLSHRFQRHIQAPLHTKATGKLEEKKNDSTDTSFQSYNYQGVYAYPMSTSAQYFRGALPTSQHLSVHTHMKTPLSYAELKFLILHGITTDEQLLSAPTSTLSKFYERYGPTKYTANRIDSYALVEKWKAAARTATGQRGSNDSRTSGSSSLLHSEVENDRDVLLDEDPPLMDNVQHLCRTVIDDATGLPRREITVFDCANEVLYDFLVDIRDSFIPGAGRGVFLTFKGVRVLRAERRLDFGNMKPSRTRALLEAKFLDGRSGLTVRLTGNNLHDDEHLMGKPDGVGAFKQYCPKEDFRRADDNITFCSYDVGCGLIELGRYAPLLPSDRKTDTVFAMKNFIFSYEPSAWRFDVPEKLQGNPQVVDFTSDVTGEPHDVARSNVPTYVNEVAHNPNLLESVVSRDDNRTVFYYICLKKSIRIGETVELLVDYKDGYEEMRERKGYGRANIDNGVKCDRDDYTRLQRNINERTLLERCICSYSVHDMESLIDFIKNRVLDGVISSTSLSLSSISSEASSVDALPSSFEVTLRQWVARRRLHWLSLRLMSHLRSLSVKYGLQTSSSPNNDLSCDDNASRNNEGGNSADILPEKRIRYKEGTPVYVNGWARPGEARPPYTGLGTVDSVTDLTARVMLYTVVVDGNKFIRDIPEHVLTSPTEEEIADATPRLKKLWRQQKEIDSWPRRALRMEENLKCMTWNPYMNEAILGLRTAAAGRKQFSPKSVLFEAIHQELSEEILYTLSRSKSLSHPYDHTHWCPLSISLMRRVLHNMTIFKLSKESDSTTSQATFSIILLRCASDAAESIRKTAESRFSSESDLKHFAFDRRAKEHSMEENASAPESLKSFFLISVASGSGEDASDSNKEECSLESVVKGHAKLHVKWYIVRQVVAVVHAMACLVNWKMVSPAAIDSSVADEHSPLYSLEKLCSAVKINETDVHAAIDMCGPLC